MQTLQGTIVSLKTAQTASVRVSRLWQHPIYKKYVKRTKQFACHYEGMELAEGMQVTITACRPMSKTKHFVITGIVGAQQ